jgi:hypothetical protein
MRRGLGALAVDADFALPELLLDHALRQPLHLAAEIAVEPAAGGVFIGLEGEGHAGFSRNFVQ